MGPLLNKHDFKLKAGPISYHLCCDFTRDSNNDLCLVPREHINKMSGSCASIFSSNPKSSFHSPLDKGNNPELDTENFIDAYGVQQC